ncbi:uncharacterized protein N7459_002631 [Penicillium hispanicum]|uniref:uncharacterized protein n=1 Tax=Penicillium hispanicum TaxID=1080232 RepID=UPI00254040D5|nr:uncharacterized protein N7459_002631 [Penicillium hispanicum]KAJ5586866.1 hypothetical protein N7459_002631 [Penicillium hispanicum]
MLNGRDRPRPSAASDSRRGGDSRNGAGESMSRAEKFEDEKKRIIQSCYSKKDSDGTLIESYITHVRIIEDAAHPSTPAPPNSAPDNKKPRVIIVSVRRSGRVRMHKARENNDGTFSIGKTWMLDDLSSIQSYSAFVPKSPAESQQKEWASNVGFVVTVGKPYYWHARSSKEKEFFIGSLVKIYKKYTGGKVPNLIGFDERERQLLAGSGPSPSPAPPPSRGAVLGSTEAAAPPAAQSSYNNRDPSRDGSRDIRRKVSEDPVLRPQKSREQISRPSTASKPVPSPFVPSSNHPPALQPAQRVEPKSKERLSTSFTTTEENSQRRANEEPRPPSSRGEQRATKSQAPTFPAQPIETKQLEPTRSTDGPRPTENIANGQASTPAVQPTETRELEKKPSTDGLRSLERAPKTKAPTLAAQPVESRALDKKRSTDALRPTTPGSFNGEPRSQAASPGGSIGQRSPYAPYRVGVEKGAVSEQPPQPQPEPSQDRPGPTVPPVVETEAPKTAYPSEEDRPSSPPMIDPAVAAAVIAAEEPQEPPKPASEPSEPAVEVPKDETPATVPESAQEEEDEAHRPGLGPMVKKKSTKDIAGAFRKAANAYGAFKPRPGGAGERLLAAAKKQKAEAAEPDGITGVVPAPSLNRTANEAPKSPVGEPIEKELPVPTPSAPQPTGPRTPTVEITQHPFEDTPAAPAAPTREQSEDTLPEIAKVDDRSRTPSPAAQGRRKRRREDHTIKYCHALGINPSVLDGRGIEFDDILTDLGWSGRLGDEQKIEDLEADVRREIGRVEATSWLGNLEQQEGKVEQLAALIDKTIEECDELDGLLTLYSHELNTLHEDVAYIEAQSQGLQVQTANQKLLQNELQNLLRTLSISTSDIRPLKEASLSNPDGLRDTENALAVLYKAMLMIDADIGQNKKRVVDASVGVYANTEIGQMRAIKEKKEEYRSAAVLFLQRLKQFMGLAFKMAEQKRADMVVSPPRDLMKLDSSARQHFREEIWRYNPLMLFAREVSMSEWHALVSLYEQQSRPSYQNEFRENNLAWKRTARKPTGEEQELLFTHQEKEKESEGITMAARKLTVRRGKTVRAATGLRLASGDKKVGKVEPCEAFAGTLRETLSMITEEQNFVVQFFHLDSLATADFSDLVATAAPEGRQCPKFSDNKSHDPDRGMAKRVEQIMDEVYSFWPNDMQSMVDWALQADPLQGIGILFGLESAITDLDDTNQEFVIHSLQKVHTRLIGLFNRFVDEQIRGIEDTKVKINKRKGVISFMRVFPNFSAAIENMLAHPNGEFCDIRINVNDAYDRINRAMWESLKFIAKEAPGQPPGVAAGAGDPEDKEVLNYHILLIENMNHYVEEVEVHNLPVLQRWVDRARQDFDEHMKLYLDAVIHRPLGKLLEFIQSIESLQASGGSADIATRASHSRMVAKKVLSSYDAKEVKRGIEMLKKRVEKHFGDADDPGLSRSLVLKVLRECERRYDDAYDRTRRIIATVYEGQLELEWRKEDTVAMFRK